MRFRSLCLVATMLCVLTPIVARAESQNALHLYYTRQLAFSVERTNSSMENYRVQAWIDPNVAPDTYFSQYPWKPLAKLKHVGDYTVHGPGRHMLSDGTDAPNSGDNATFNIDGTNATFALVFWFDRPGQHYPHIDVVFDVDRRHSWSNSRNTMRFMEGAGNYVLLYGGPRDIYVHYDRSQNNLPIPRPPYRTCVADNRIAFIGGELVATSDEAYASLQNDWSIKHRNVAETQYVWKHGWFNSGGPSTARPEKHPSVTDAAQRYLGTKLIGIVLYEEKKASYAIDYTGLIRTIGGTKPNSVIGYLDAVSGKIRRGTPVTDGEVIAMIDRLGRIATIRNGLSTYRAQIDKHTGTIFGPCGETIGKARPPLR